MESGTKHQGEGVWWKGGENKKKDRACGRGQRKEGERQNESVCELERVRVRKVNKQERLKRNIPGTGG